MALEDAGNDARRLGAGGGHKLTADLGHEFHRGIGGRRGRRRGCGRGERNERAGKDTQQQMQPTGPSQDR